jgi:cobalt-zinc-cadmium resistance protein CzcA
MGPVSTGLGEVLHYVLSSADQNLTDLHTIQDWIASLRFAGSPALWR